MARLITEKIATYYPAIYIKQVNQRGLIMKKCFKCNIEKELTNFYKHSKMGDGHLNKCKDCTKIDNRNNRDKNLDYYRDYDKKRNQLDHRKKASNSNCFIYRKKNPKKYKAHAMIGRAVRSGKLIKPTSCESCKAKTQLHAHHDDYNKPLNVRWLCPICHSAWHKNNEALNQT